MEKSVGIVSLPDRENKSAVLRKLSSAEIELLGTDLEINRTLIKKHRLFNHKVIKENVLRHGNSIFLYNFSRAGLLLEDNKDKFSNTLKLIFQFLPQYKIEQLGRAYWHILQPGERIDCHHDNITGYMNDIHRNEIDRYHIFLNVPRDLIVVMDGELWNIPEYKNRSISNSLIKFNLLDYHYYNNHSERSANMLVFDFFKMPFTVKSGHMIPKS